MTEAWEKEAAGSTSKAALVISAAIGLILLRLIFMDLGLDLRPRLTMIMVLTSIFVVLLVGEAMTMIEETRAREARM